jgi:two-component system, NarL family, nitrate/nitrite response regulator NarL
MKVLVVDDHILFRQGLVSLLQVQPDFQVVGEAGSAREAVEKAAALQPNLILMDFNLPDSSGVEAAREILSECLDCKIIFLTIYADDEKMLEAVRGGACGYLLKNVPIAQLLRALRSTQDGDAAISRSMMAKVMNELARTAGQIQPEQKTNSLDKLSTRELDVLREISSGASNDEIARRLFISKNTVKHHVHSMLDKLDMENRGQLAKTAKRNGLQSRFTIIPTKQINSHA